MISQSRPITRFEKLTEAYAQLGSEFRDIGNAKLVELVDTWEKSLSQMHSMLIKNKPLVKRSAFVAGLEQGLREIPSLLSELPEVERRLALKTLSRVMESMVPGFFEKNRETLDKIVARGKIKNKDEWYLIRHHVDEIEGDSSQLLQLAELYKLIDNYENIA